ncbi:hypothetical protein SAMN06297129_0684 [Pseudooceanicola antarcticus]|uniref:Uncharacterized protein n=2 Tax=Pseudooceanicola antarcticus TaxID=1247613 RepID=A0A285HWR3_9RHOB|nr:hypothetical protein CVM39_12385 [Pseudooceanicola antarcticus]SNY40083.1 hypothetical protein SAMN06297129_0684 [Pseudooceanicola antarcticus]
MNYDFDMHSILPLAAQRKARLAGRGGDLSGQQIALFRDPRVVEALRRADPEVQELFLESGFGLTSWLSNVPEGSFRSSESRARNRVITRFAANLRRSSGNLRNSDWGGFELSAFTDSYLSAQPIAAQALDRDKPEPVPQPRRSPRPEPRARRRRFGGVDGLHKLSAIGLIAVAYLLLLTVWYSAGNDRDRQAAELGHMVQMF